MGLFDLATKQFLKLASVAKDAGEKIAAIEKLRDTVAKEHHAEIEALAITEDKAGVDFKRIEFAPRPNAWKLEYLPIGQYQRLKLIADKITEAFERTTTVADVGGSEGCLSLFLPDCRYILVDKNENGLDATKATFDENSFDVVVSCDTLEHVPKPKREAFIDNLIHMAKDRVYLLAPFGKSNRELEEIMQEIAPNPWMKEHLEHDFSTLDEVREMLNERNLKFETHSCSFEPAHLTMIILTIKFLRDMPEHRQLIQEFYNTNYCDICRQKPSYGRLFVIFRHG